MHRLRCWCATGVVLKSLSSCDQGAHVKGLACRAAAQGKWLLLLLLQRFCGVCCSWALWLQGVECLKEALSIAGDAQGVHDTCVLQCTMAKLQAWRDLIHHAGRSLSMSDEYCHHAD